MYLYILLSVPFIKLFTYLQNEVHHSETKYYVAFVIEIIVISLFC